MRLENNRETFITCKDKNFKCKVNNYIYGNLKARFADYIVSEIKIDRSHKEITFKYDPGIAYYLNQFRGMQFEEVK